MLVPPKHVKLQAYIIVNLYVESRAYFSLLITKNKYNRPQTKTSLAQDHTTH